MKKNIWKVIVVIIGVILNVAGGYLARSLNLPIWLDTMGTFIASYFVGIWGGLIAAISNNLILGFYDVTALVYSLKSVIAVFVILIFIKKGYLNHALKAVVLSFWLGIICTIVSTPLNLIFNGGYSGNTWGDTLIDMLKWYDVSDIIAAMAGEAIVSVVDMQICVLLAFLIIYCVNRLNGRNTRRINSVLLILFGICLLGTVKPIYANAEGVSSKEAVSQEQIYTVSEETHVWENSTYKNYLVIVCVEIILFTIISIAGMILFVMRKSELEKLRLELERKLEEQTGGLKEQQKKINDLFLQTVAALSEAVEAKDRYTSGHSKRVAEYARMIAERMGKTKEEQEEIYCAGLLHDVGKIRIPNEIINKVGKLTDDEYNIIKIHPVTGFHILREISANGTIALAAKYHHERYDGKGYPNGIVGERIPEVARILGVADSYDAMTSNRSYRRALPQEIVRSEIEKGKGTQFDPDVADIMLQMIDEDKNYVMKQAEFLHKRILVVDDEEINHELIEYIMRDEPMYEILAAGGGREALTMLDKQHYDLILLDVMMPEMDGLETLKLIREKYQTPVVLMTGNKTLDTSTGFTALGCDDYITKPFLPILIKEVIHNMVERTNINNSN